VPQHSHQKTYFCLLLQGVYEETWGRDTFVRKPGTLALAASGGVHSNRIHSSGIRFFSIEMTQPWLDRANGHLKYFQGLTQFDNGLLPWLAMRLYREFRCEDDVAPLAIEGLVLELLAGLARQSPQSERGAVWLKKAQDFVHDRFQRSISLVELKWPSSQACILCRWHELFGVRTIAQSETMFAGCASNSHARNSLAHAHHWLTLLSPPAFRSRATFLEPSNVLRV
jgi:AraC-like ligand binding domain